MRFEFATANRIIFGAGTISEVKTMAARYGQRVLLIGGHNLQRLYPLRDDLTAAGFDVALFSVPSEPSLALVQHGLEVARQHSSQMVIGVGGGSVLDGAKAIAGLLTNAGDIFNYLEVIGRGQPLANQGAPYIAIPTTAGTGAEVTSNAVLFSPEHQVKVSLRSPLMLPRVAIVDPVLTYEVPPAITAMTGMDAFTQVLEAFVSNKANPITDALCREGIYRAARSLRRAYQDGYDAAAREDMALTSLFSGIALSNAKLGAVHGFAGPLGGMATIPHGAVCAALLAPVMAANLTALQARQPAHPSLARFTEIARLVTGDAHANPADGIVWLQTLTHDLNIQPLSAYGVTNHIFEALLPKAVASSSMQGNPIQLTEEELRTIFTAAL